MAVDELSRTFAALADPTRRAILARLRAGRATVGEIAAPFDMTLAAVSKHLHVLESAGLVTRGKDAQFRPASLDARPLAAASRWFGDYARFWDDSLSALDHYLNAQQELRDDPSPSLGETSGHDKENPHG